MSWAKRIWRKAREIWRKSKLVGGVASAVERATQAYIESREFQEAASA